MKPIYIEMKAFGSYRDEKIDFTGKSQGLFSVSYTHLTLPTTNFV